MLFSGREGSYSSDFWAFGVIVFMLLHGYHPFAVENNDAETKRRICDGEILAEYR